MKQLFLLLILNVSLFSCYSQELVEVKNPVTYTIGSDASHLYCLQQTIELEVPNWTFDSCNFYLNRFNVTFPVYNGTNETITCTKNQIIWYDACCNIRSSGSVAISSGETKNFVIEVVAYHKRKIKATGEFTIKSDQDTLIIPVKLNVECTSKKCRQNKNN